MYVVKLWLCLCLPSSLFRRDAKNACLQPLPRHENKAKASTQRPWCCNPGVVLCSCQVPNTSNLLLLDRAMARTCVVQEWYMLLAFEERPTHPPQKLWRSMTLTRLLLSAEVAAISRRKVVPSHAFLSLNLTGEEVIFLYFEPNDFIFAVGHFRTKVLVRCPQIAAEFLQNSVKTFARARCTAVD